MITTKDDNTATPIDCLERRHLSFVVYVLNSTYFTSFVYFASLQAARQSSCHARLFNVWTAGVKTTGSSRRYFAPSLRQSTRKQCTSRQRAGHRNTYNLCQALVPGVGKHATGHRQKRENMQPVQRREACNQYQARESTRPVQNQPRSQGLFPLKLGGF